MKHQHRRRFLSACSLAALSLGLAPSRLLSDSSERTPRIRVVESDSTSSGFAEVTLFSRGQGENFERFIPHRCKILMRPELDDDAFEILDNQRQVSSELSSAVLERWSAHRQREPFFRWEFNVLFVDSDHQQTDQLDIVGSALVANKLNIRMPLYAYAGTDEAIPAMLILVHAPSFSRPIPIALTWMGRNLEEAQTPLPDTTPDFIQDMSRRYMVAEHEFSDRQKNEYFRAVHHRETIEFDFYDASGFDSLKQAAANLPRNTGPLFRIKMPISRGNFHSTIMTAAELLETAIEKIKQGHGVEEEYRAPNCYLTTAACEAVGLPDDCWELQTLRRFRDTALPLLDEGHADIARYYAEAPTALKQLRRKPGAHKQLLKIYWQTILPCCILAHFGANKLCHRLYRRQHHRLCQTFLSSQLSSTPGHM